MMKKFLVSLMAVATLFASCNNDETTPTKPEGTSNVILQIGDGSATGTRAEGGLVQTNPTLVMDEGYIFFTDVTGIIERYVEIKNGANASDDNEIELSTVQAGTATIANVPTSAVKCYILSRIPSSVTIPSVINNTVNINSILNQPMHVNDLYDLVAADGGVGSVPMFGEGTVNNTVNPMTTSVDVYAMGARLQIEKLTGTVDIDGYQLDGIFINNYYVNMDGAYKPTNIVDNSSDVGKYQTPSGGYDTYFLSDYNAAGIGSFNNTTKETTPATGAAWVYNVWPTEGLTTPDATTVPHVVLVLSNIDYNVGGTAQPTITGKRYLTVKGMIDNSSGAPTAVTKIQKGNSYTFSDIQFEFSDLTTVPEIESINAVVTINMINWKNNPVLPEL